MSKTADTATLILGKHPQWTRALKRLRKLLLGTELEEAVRWGGLSYLLDGKIVVGIGAFKEHCALWFHQGAFLKDKQKRLINAQEGITRGNRQMRFSSESEIDDTLVLSYIKEAIANQKAGKVIKPQVKSLNMPVELKNALQSDAELKKKFAALSPGNQREFADHIAAAKQETTRLSRVEKAIPMIKKGTGLHDKYR